MNRFFKSYLVIIVALLAVIALRPTVTPQAARAASHRYQYLVVTTPNASAPQI